MDLFAAIVALIIALSIHEFAHAWAAEYLGDPTARLQGRLTLNPLAHLDKMGSLVFAVTLFTSIQTGTNFVFGWGKPVPVDPFNLRNPRRDSGIIAAAGPISNIVLSLLITAILAILLRIEPSPFINNTAQFLLQLMMINVFLAVFNLIPIHPLDGGKILTGFLPAEPAQKINTFLNQYGLIILFAIIIFNVVDIILSPIADTILYFLIYLARIGIA